jgi:glucosamine--fructose-6-phosphate aminotransferase (isomerizing)
MGASWNAALGAGSLFHSFGCPVYLLDAAELLYSANFPGDSVLIILSRSGQSAEIVKLVEKAHAASVPVIGITSFPDGALAKKAEISIILPVKPDNGISVNTYVSLVAGVAALAAVIARRFDAQLVSSLLKVISATGQQLARWQEQLAQSTWLEPGPTYCFLARGPSVATCYAAQLLWQEGAKTPAIAMESDNFRHGPQEMIQPGMRFAIWVDSNLRQADLAIARDLQQLGARVMAVGVELEEDVAELVFDLPLCPIGWQFIVDIIPAQLAAESLARLSGVDCDSFRFASYVVQANQGLLDS